MRWIIAPILLLALLKPAWGEQPAARQPEELRAFFASREVLARIPFAPGSAQLGPKGRRAVQDILPRLQSLDFRAKLLRIEGSGDPEAGEEGLTLAMMRAKAVSDYLRGVLAEFDLMTLTGQVASKASAQVVGSKSHVDLAIYDNLLNIHSAEIEQTIIR